MRGARIAFGWLLMGVLASPLACNAILGITDVTEAPHDGGRGGGDDGSIEQPGDEQVMPPDPEAGIPDTGVPEAGPGTNDIQVALMSSSTCARKVDGTVSCWGSDTLGQLGDGLDPDAAPAMTSSPGKAVMASDGTALNAIALAGGEDHTCAIRSDALRTVACWGYNHFGQLGVSNADNTLSHPVVVANLSGVTMLAAGSVSTCALKIDGSVMCWGANYAGQLGNNTKVDSFAPVSVFEPGEVTAIAAGDEHVCALRKDKTVVCWGSNSDGQLANATAADSQVPAPVPITDVVAIAAGGTFSCALFDGGTPGGGGGVQCWGSNLHGELGNGATNAMSNPTPVAVLSLGDAIEIWAGYGHACALRHTGEIKCWGDNFNGELGAGFSDPDAGTDMPTPVPVQGIANGLRVVTGGAHTCATTKDEHLFCWGENSSGQLGDTSTFDRATPVPVTGF